FLVRTGSAVQSRLWAPARTGPNITTRARVRVVGRTP
ncbi:uncharacterized protein METZ01_LOCUS14023, partial [marine metagenome]